MKVTTWYLELTMPGESAVSALPPGVRVDRTATMSPEYARFLNGLVGGPWRWVDRLDWTREQWGDELATPGTEFLVAYGDAQPLGFVHLQAQPHTAGSQVEIRYFGLVEAAIGRGLGRALLERGIEAAWTLPERHDLAPVRRVWLHTCSLDGPAALDNYRARGFAVYNEQVTDADVPDEPLGAWMSTGGPVGDGS
jgi:GNAT superfamily N-acetyltransferase